MYCKGNAQKRDRLMRNLATALVTNEYIKTTVARGKELRKMMEKSIEMAKEHSKLDAGIVNEELAKIFFPHTSTFAMLRAKLLFGLPQRYAQWNGPYTTLWRIGKRPGDKAELALVQLQKSPFDLATFLHRQQQQQSKAHQ